MRLKQDLVILCVGGLAIGLWLKSLKENHADHVALDHKLNQLAESNETKNYWLECINKHLKIISVPANHKQNNKPKEYYHISRVRISNYAKRQGISARRLKSKKFVNKLKQSYVDNALDALFEFYHLPKNTKRIQYLGRLAKSHYLGKDYHAIYDLRHNRAIMHMYNNKYHTYA